jgi:hypothetical protein
MGLVHDNEIPLCLLGGFEAALIAREEVYRDDEDAFFVARELPWLCIKRGTVDQASVDPELILNLLFFPLFGKSARRDDQDLLDDSAEEEFLHQEPGHDGLACAGIIRQEEPNARQWQEITVHRFHLVGQRINDA